MPIPLPNLASALISPACHAWANTLDNLFGERFKGQVTFLIAVSKVLQLLLVVPLVLVIGPDLQVTPEMLGLMAVVAIIEFVYVYPYFWALAHADTSVVVALFSLGKVMLPVLAWVFLKEQLGLWQYVGFLVIILSGLMLTFNWEKFHFNKAAGCMLVVSLLLSGEAIISKHVLVEGVTWEAFTVWTMALEGGIGAMMLLARPGRTQRRLANAGPRMRRLFVLEALLSMVGNAGGVLALSLLPVSVAKAISSTQPLFVALYARLFRGVWPRYFRENDLGLHPLVKMAGLVLTIVGTVMAAGY